MPVCMPHGRAHLTMSRQGCVFILSPEPWSHHWRQNLLLWKTPLCKSPLHTFLTFAEDVLVRFNNINKESLLSTFEGLGCCLATRFLGQSQRRCCSIHWERTHLVMTCHTPGIQKDVTNAAEEGVGREGGLERVGGKGFSVSAMSFDASITG